MPEHLIIDCETGEETTRPLTAEEQASADARATLAERARQVESDHQANRTTIEDAVRAHLADLRTIRISTGTLTGAQLSNAVRALAKGQTHVIRLLIGALDDTD